MSQSPRDTDDVQHSAPSPDDDAPQQTEGDAADMNRPDLDLGYDFEVKEQDRWLPIANGAYSNPPSPFTTDIAHILPIRSPLQSCVMPRDSRM
jgi:hypothetical protein